MAVEAREESRVKLLRIKYTLLTNATFFSGVLGAPNVHFLNTNVLMYLIAFVTLSKLNGGLSDPLVAEYQFYLPANLSAMYIMWGLLQSRELMRFNEQQKTNQEKGQLSDIFDSLSDAILIVDPEVKESTDRPGFVFCNKQSFKLFGENFATSYECDDLLQES